MAVTVSTGFLILLFEGPSIVCSSILFMLSTYLNLFRIGEISYKVDTAQENFSVLRTGEPMGDPNGELMFIAPAELKTFEFLIPVFIINMLLFLSSDSR